MLGTWQKTSRYKSAISLVGWGYFGDTLGVQVVSRMTGKREILNGDFWLEILSSRWGLCTKHILQEIVQEWQHL